MYDQMYVTDGFQNMTGHVPAKHRTSQHFTQVQKNALKYLQQYSNNQTSDTLIIG